MTVTTIYGDISDGRLRCSNPSYDTARDGTGTISYSSTTPYSYCGQTGGYDFYEAFYAFDTSSIPDGDTVTSPVLSLYPYNLGSAVNFEVRSYDFGVALTGADFIPGANLGSYTLVATLATATNAVYNTFTPESAFSSNVNKTGFTRLVITTARQRLGETASGSEDARWYAAESTGTTFDPYLTITHTASSGSINLEQSYSTSTANSFTLTKTISLQQASTSSIPGELTIVKTATLIQASEVITPVSGVPSKRIQIEQSVETEVSRSFTGSKQISLSQIGEVSESDSLSFLSGFLLEQGIEVDEGTVLDLLKTIGLIQVQETDVSNQITASRAVGIGQSGEASYPNSLGFAKTIPLEQCQEIDVPGILRILATALKAQSRLVSVQIPSYLASIARNRNIVRI